MNLRWMVYVVNGVLRILLVLLLTVVFVCCTLYCMLKRLLGIHVPETVQTGVGMALAMLALPFWACWEFVAHFWGERGVALHNVRGPPANPRKSPR